MSEASATASNNEGLTDGFSFVMDVCRFMQIVVYKLTQHAYLEIHFTA